MAFTGCRNCRYYNDTHVSPCPCRFFDPAGDSLEGTDIYRFDPDPSGGFGYHLVEIPKGEIGEVSKIEEEFLEFKDAVSQEAVVMQLCELSDMLGAIDAWLTRHHPSVKLSDLLKMSDLTRKAFRHGRRK